MSTNKTEGAYERMALQMLLRHELPEDFEARIEITAKGGKTAKAVFVFDGNAAKVKSSIADLGLKRSIVGVVPCW